MLCGAHSEHGVLTNAISDRDLYQIFILKEKGK
jgi:hypothetical protein